MVNEVGFQVADEQRWPAGHGYYGCVIHIEGRPDMLRGCGLILSMRRASCKDVLCMGPNPNCSSPARLRSLTSFRIRLNKMLESDGCEESH